MPLATKAFKEFGELQENLNKDNLQPSSENISYYVSEKVHRLTGEDEITNKPDTSAEHPIKDDDIVGTI